MRKSVNRIAYQFKSFLEKDLFFSSPEKQAELVPLYASFALVKIYALEYHSRFNGAFPRILTKYVVRLSSPAGASDDAFQTHSATIREN